MLKTAPKLLQSFWKPLITTIRNHPYPETFHEFLRGHPLTICTKLCNGLTIATEERNSPHTCIGIYIDGGSRYESDYENGIAHFFEHMAFKGTCTRTKEALHDQMSSTGARFNCYTSREIVAYYAECLNDDVPVVTDILSDCIFNNCLSPEEIEAQKKIVYSEMLKHDVDETELLFDYLHIGSYMGTPLAQTVMGPSSNLYNFCDSTITRYLQKAFDPSRIVLAAVGGITHDQVVHLADLYLSRLEPLKCIEPDPCRFTAADIRYRQDSLPVANIAIAFEAPGFCDIDKYAMEVAGSLIGGWDYTMQAGANHAHQLARAASSYNMCQAYKSFYIKYKDTGLWGVQFMVPMLSAHDYLDNIQYELMKSALMVNDAEVDRAKRELKTKLLTRTESASGTCHDIGRWTLYYGYRPPLHERIATIERISCQDVQDVCTKYLYDKDMSISAVGAIECLLVYPRIKLGQYWLRY